MKDLLVSPLASAALTFTVYGASLVLYKRTRLFFLHPVLTAVILLMAVLNAAGIPYADYERGGRLITMLLGPAVVSLGVPLYKEMHRIKREGSALFLTTLFGSLVGIFSAVLPAVLLGASREVVVSLAPKSVTSPIAMAIAGGLGGIPPLTTAIVVLTGIIGAVTGPAVLKLLNVTGSAAFGLAIGFSAHGIGTARAIEIGREEAAFSSLGLCLNGFMTAILTPPIVRLLAF